MIAILMATYNGEEYVAEQIESLLKQTVQDFVVYVCDDCSTDNTFRILKNYELQYPNKLVLSRNEHNTGGAKYNFMQMMVHYKSDYVMLCDQDDIWKPDKIMSTLHAIKRMESTYGQETPLLVHTDLSVVDSLGQPICDSFLHFSQLNGKETHLNRILIQNVVTGCTVMYNAALAQLMTAVPQSFVMHDNWVALLACAFGNICFLEQSTIAYRQHDNNNVGARNPSSIAYWIHKLSNLSYSRKLLQEAFHQANSFLCLYGEKLSPQQHKLISRFTMIPTKGKIERCIELYRLGTLKSGTVPLVAMFILI